MSEVNLPSEWIATELENIGDVVTGKTPNKNKPEYFGGDIPFIKPGDVNDQGEITLTDEQITVLGAETVPLIPPGSIVVTCIGNLGRCAITTARSATNQQINSVLPCSNVDVKFLYYQLRTLKEWMLSESSATTVTIINKSKFSKAPIICPAIPEQKIIADKLDTLLAQVETTKARLERIPEILKTFRQSVLAAAVSGKLLERKAEWKTEVLRNCFDCIDGDRGPNYPKKNDYQSEGYCLFLSTKNVRQFGFDFKETVFISKEKDNILRKGKLARGDLVITTRGTLGHVASYDNSVPYEVARINSGMLILRKKNPSFVNDYFKILIASPYFQKLIETNRTGSAQPQLPAKILKEFKLPVPPSEEQTEIVRRVEKLFAFADSIEQKTNAALERVNNLTQSILAKAFRGELTAKWREQNPELISGENSAEALLAKIKAERC